MYTSEKKQCLDSLLSSTINEVLLHLTASTSVSTNHFNAAREYVLSLLTTKQISEVLEKYVAWDHEVKIRRVEITNEDQSWKGLLIPDGDVTRITSIDFCTCESGSVCSHRIFAILDVLYPSPSDHSEVEDLARSTSLLVECMNKARDNSLSGEFCNTENLLELLQPRIKLFS